LLGARVGVEDTVPMEPGDQFAVYVHLGQVTMVLYTVRHCTRRASGVYHIGARLAGFVGAAGGDADRVLTSLIAQQLV
jgi:hypothetical protein